jgi:[protein-PII] uridylyltransferase
VAAPDRPGLLATVAGVLTLCGVTIRSATTMSDASTAMALLQFQVTPAFDNLPDWDRVRADLAAALEGRLALPARLEERERHYARYRRASAAAAPQARVTIDNSASATSTVVEVRAPDRGPVLYQVAGALAGRGLTIAAALINTLGAEVIDVFYVQTATGGQVVDAAEQERLASAVAAAL